MDLKPTQNPSNVRLIADLDSLVSEQVGFKFNGKVYILNPVTAEQLMKMELARVKLIHMLNSRAEGVVMTDDDIYQRYFDFVNPIVPTITYAEIRSMSAVVLNGLLSLVFRQLSGDTTLYQKDDEKKNTLTRMTGL